MSLANSQQWHYALWGGYLNSTAWADPEIGLDYYGVSRVALWRRQVKKNGEFVWGTRGFKLKLSRQVVPAKH